MSTQQRENEVVRAALRRLCDDTEQTQRVVIDLFESGFEDVDEIVELAHVARESFLQGGGGTH